MSSTIYLEATVVVSPCGKYRYHLGRKWDATLPRMTFLMLNPSTATGEKDDPTIRKCVGFATRAGCGGIDVVNVAAFRATDPIVLYTAMQSKVDVVGPQNDEYVRQFLTANQLRVAAWGGQDVRAFHAGSRAFLTLFTPILCLGRTKLGQPRHPLMISYGTALERYL